MTDDIMEDTYQEFLQFEDETRFQEVQEAWERGKDKDLPPGERIDALNRVLAEVMDGTVANWNQADTFLLNHKRTIYLWIGFTTFFMVFYVWYPIIYTILQQWFWAA